MPLLGCVSGIVRGVKAEKPDTSSPQMPGIVFRERKTSPAKSLVMRKSWSIMVKRMTAPRVRHWSALTQLRPSWKRNQKLIRILSDLLFIDGF